MTQYLLQTDFFGEPLMEDFKSSAKKFQAQGAPEQEVDQYIQRFKTLRDKQRIKDAKQKDIDTWAKGSFDDFKKFVDGLSSEKSSTEKKKEAKTEGAELVAENANWRVYRITSKQACLTYGANTKWCITSKDTEHWEHYSSKNNFYFILSKTDQHGVFNKIAAQVDQNGKTIYWDETDKSHPSLPDELGVPAFIAEKAEGKVKVNGTWMTLAEFMATENLEVKGDLSLRGLPISHLPKGLKVTGLLDLSSTDIISLPDDLSVGSLYLDLTSKIVALPKGLKIQNTLAIAHSQVRSIPADIEIGGDLIATYSRLKTLPEGLGVNNLDLMNSPILSLPAGLNVRGRLDLRLTRIKSLPDDLSVGEDILVDDEEAIQTDSYVLKNKLETRSSY